MKDPFRGEMQMLQKKEKKKILKPPYIVILVVVRARVRARVFASSRVCYYHFCYHYYASRACVLLQRACAMTTPV